jgi:RHS repeat-associated protein
MDRLVTKATPEGTLNYTLNSISDAAGHVATIASSNTNGASVSYSYDDLNRLSAVVDNRLSSGANTTTYAYDPANNLATATYPNGLQSAFTYDSLNRMTTLVTPVSGYSYQFDATGKRTQAVEVTGRTLNWNYDGINRLTQETIADAPASNNGVVSYSLDPVGNRLSDTSSLSGVSSSSATFNADDELSSETYDSNGNTLTTGGKTFTYDAENHLTGMSVSGTAVSIVYDAFGNRVSKTVNGVTTKYLVEDDVNPTGYPQVMDEIVRGSVERTYTYGLQRINQDQLLSSAWTPSFYGYDGAGSVRQLTNAAGTVTDTYDYDAFGNQVNHTGTTPNNYLYRAEQYDSDLRLYYLRARYYNPLTGRFLSRDPVSGSSSDPKSLHKYLYAGGEPVNADDPTGRAELVATAGFDLWQATKDAALATATGAAITCAYFKLASAEQLLVAYGGSTNQLFTTSLCSFGSECEKLIQEIYFFMDEITVKINDLLIDQCDLYNLAYNVPDPSLPGGCAGTTWVGHQQQVLDLQQGLRNRLKEAEKKGCLIPPGAWAIATRPIPNQPRGN